jgi:hypothetical protein
MFFFGVTVLAKEKKMAKEKQIGRFLFVRV